MIKNIKSPKNSTLKNCIWETKNYEMFKFIDCNRDINKNHIKNLTEKMTTKEFEQPIIVKEENGYYSIMEGQHRYTVAKQNNLPVYYMIENTLSLDDIITMNTIKKATSNKDYLKWFYKQAKNGNTKYNNYIIYNNFIKKYNLQKQEHKSIMLIEGTYMRPNNLWNNFRAGELVIKDYKKSCRLIEQFDDIGKYLQGIRTLGNPVFYAYMQAFNSPDYNHKRMIYQLEKPMVILTKQIDKENYMNQINISYNKGVQEQNRINLFEYI